MHHHLIIDTSDMPKEFRGTFAEAWVKEGHIPVCNLKTHGVELLDAAGYYCGRLDWVAPASGFGKKGE